MEKDNELKEMFNKFIRTGQIKDYLTYKEKERSSNGIKGRHNNKNHKL